MWEKRERRSAGGGEREPGEGVPGGGGIDRELFDHLRETALRSAPIPDRNLTPRDVAVPLGGERPEMIPKQERRAPSPTEVVLLDGLLTTLYRRMAGALDLGLVLLLEPPREQYTRFLQDHVAAPMRAAALVLRLSMAECVPEPTLSAFQAVEADTARFIGCLEELSEYGSLSDERLRAVAGGLAAAHGKLTDTFLDIAERLCFEPGLGGQFGAERREALRQAILDLPAALSAERVDAKALRPNRGPE